MDARRKQRLSYQTGLLTFSGLGGGFRPRHLNRYALPVMKLERAKILGVYLIAICSLQICLYLALSVAAEKYLWLFYFDPRIGVFFLETIIRGSEQVVPGIFRWLSAVWILALGVFLFSGRPLIKTYVFSEIILFLPSLLFSLFIAAANLGPTHGFSVGELFIPILVMIVFSIIPLGLAFWLLWSSRFKGEVKIFE
jgi:hypothetical protein